MECHPAESRLFSIASLAFFASTLLRHAAVTGELFAFLTQGY